MKSDIIQMKNISKSYGDNKVLSELDFTVKEGTIMGLIGKNGAGKSTLIKILLGLVKPDSGVASVFGEDSWKLSAVSKNRIGYVPQTMSGMKWMKVKDLMSYTSSFYSKWDSAKVSDLLKDWDLDIYSKVGTLSEGERQKLSIIQALGHDPDLYIFDEPVASLDPQARRKFIKKLIDMNLNDNKTVLFSTHITSDLERVAADISLLKEGSLSFIGDLSDLKDKVCRLRITSSEKIPEFIGIKNMISSRFDGRNALITVDGIDDEEINRLESTYSIRIQREDLNLEDIFLELSK